MCSSDLELFNLGNFTGAEAELLKIIQRRPGTPDAWQLLGAVYYRLDRMDAAERAFRHLIRQQPFNAAGYNNLSQTLIRLNRMPEALETALQAAELAPGNGAILLNVAGLYAKERDDKEALYYLRRTLAAGVPPEVIARDTELVRLLERPEFMKLFEEQRQKAPAESVPSAVAPAAVVPYRENTSSVRLLTDEFNLPESTGENRKESAPLPVKIESAPPDGGTR